MGSVLRTRWLTVAVAVVVLCGALVCGRASTSSQTPSLAAADLERIDAIVEQAMTRSDTTGLSLAITYRGRLVLARAYGEADPATGEPMSTDHRFRIGSVSKSMTAIEIMRLIERGRLRLDQRVFGEGSLLDGAEFADPRVRDITVQQLLEHTAGGWDNDSQDGSVDPILLQPQLDRDALLTWVVRNVRLEHAPGTVHQYSNVGYLALGRIIEHVTGLPYADAMRRDVFAPAGADSFALSARTRLAHEVAYTRIGGPADAPYRYPLERTGAAGAWVATPTDLLRVAVRVDGFESVPDLLGPQAIATMTTPSDRNAHYAKGWFVNDIPNWWHLGYAPGTSALLVRTADRYGVSGRDAFTWAAVTNSNHAQPQLDLDLDALMWRVATEYAGVAG